MGSYLGMRIAAEALIYSAVLALYPQFKDDIDAYLILKGRSNLIVNED